MSKSSEYLYRCLDVMKADPNLSEESKIIMFVEYSRLVSEETKSSEWIKYNWNDVSSRPTVTGKYEVYRKGCDKQCYERWNGSGWAYNANDITHYRVIKPPYIQ